jgi:hypothetical protein
MRLHKPSPVLLAACCFFALLLGVDVATPERSAYADQWQLYGSPQGPYCEGCCWSLCCEVDHPCRVPPIQPGG